MNSTELAINGGEKSIKIDMPKRNAFGKEEKQAVMDVIDFYGTEGSDPGYYGPFEKKFCDSFSEYMQGGYTSAVATGTGALYVAIAALELPKGSEVILSPITDPGSFNAIVLHGLKVSLADSESGSLNTSWQQIKKVITPNTSAILVVHCAGISTDINEITINARKLGIKVIEDCSQSPGGVFNGKKLGTFGDISALSTMYRKSLATGGSGGVIFTLNKSIYNKVLSYADRGKALSSDKYEEKNAETYLFPALNWNTNEISCAIGCASLQRLDETINRRKAFVLYFTQLAVEKLSICSVAPFIDGSSPFFLKIQFNESKANCAKSNFCEALLAEGVELNPHYRFVISTWKWATSYLTKHAQTPNAINARDNSFNLYLNENYTQETADMIVNAMLKVETCFAT